jgi:hypothetical protein
MLSPLNLFVEHAEEDSSSAGDVNANPRRTRRRAWRKDFLGNQDPARTITFYASDGLERKKAKLRTKRRFFFVPFYAVAFFSRGEQGAAL